MNQVGFQRAVFEMLKYEYGITDTRIESGGKHNHIVFSRGSATIKTTWPKAPIAKGDWGITLDIKCKDLRRMLGKPIARKPVVYPPSKWQQPQVTKPQEALMPDTSIADTVRDKLPSLAAQLDNVAPQPANEQEHYAGEYKGGVSLQRTALVFFIPAELKRWFGDHGVELSRVSHHGWKLTPNDGVPKHDYGKRVKHYPHFSLIKKSGEYGLTLSRNPRPEAISGLPLFSRTDTVFKLYPDGSILAEITGELKSLRGYTKRQPEALVATDTQSPAPTAPAEVKLAPKLLEYPPTTTEIRATLAAIRRIEAETEYRLARSKESNAWVFVSRIEA